MSFNYDYLVVYVILKINLNFVLFGFLYLLSNFFDVKTCEETIVACFFSSKLYASPRKFLR